MMLFHLNLKGCYSLPLDLKMRRSLWESSARVTVCFCGPCPNTVFHWGVFLVRCIEVSPPLGEGVPCPFASHRGAASRPSCVCEGVCSLQTPLSSLNACRVISMAPNAPRGPGSTGERMKGVEGKQTLRLSLRGGNAFSPASPSQESKDKPRRLGAWPPSCPELGQDWWVPGAWWGHAG